MPKQSASDFLKDAETKEPSGPSAAEFLGEGTEAPGMMDKLKEGFAVSPGVQKAAEVLETPIRMGRAAAVGVGEALKGSGLEVAASPVTGLMPQTVSRIAGNVPGAIDRAGAAMDPNFQPANPNEAIAATIGETGAMALEMLPIMMAVRNQAVAGGLSAGTLETIRQAAREGRIEPLEIGKEVGIGAALPMIKPAAEWVTRTSKTVLKNLIHIASSKHIPEKAIDIALDNPKLLEEFTGLGDDIRDKVLTLQKSVQTSRQTAGKLLNETRKEFGIDRPLSRPIKVTTPKNPEQLDKDFNDVMSTLPYVTKPGPKVKFIDKMIHEIREALEPPKPGTTLPPISGEVEAQLTDRLKRLQEVLDTFPEGKKLRTAEKAFSETARMYDEIQQKLSNPDSAEQLLLKIYKGADFEDLLGTGKSALDALTKIGKETGTDLVSPIMKELSARSFKQFAPQGISGALLTSVATILAAMRQPALILGGAAVSSPRVAFTTLQAAKKTGKAINKAAQGLSSKPFRAALEGYRVSNNNEDSNEKE